MNPIEIQLHSIETEKEKGLGKKRKMRKQYLSAINHFTYIARFDSKGYSFHAAIITDRERGRKS